MDDVLIYTPDFFELYKDSVPQNVEGGRKDHMIFFVEFVWH